MGENVVQPGIEPGSSEVGHWTNPDVLAWNWKDSNVAITEETYIFCSRGSSLSPVDHWFIVYLPNGYQSPGFDSRLNL